MDFLLCKEERKCGLPWGSSVPAAPILFQSQNDELFDGDTDGIVYPGAYGKRCGVYVQPFPEPGTGR